MALAERRDCKDHVSVFVCSDWQLLRVGGARRSCGRVADSWVPGSSRAPRDSVRPCHGLAPEGGEWACPGCGGRDVPWDLRVCCCMRRSACSGRDARVTGCRAAQGAEPRPGRAYICGRAGAVGMPIPSEHRGDRIHWAWSVLARSCLSWPYRGEAEPGRKRRERGAWGRQREGPCWALSCLVGSSHVLASLGPPRCSGRILIAEGQSCRYFCPFYIRKLNTKCVK